jgi:DtxR family Mn-dependent transcriptional regulator
MEYSESFDEYLEAIYRLSLQNIGGWVKNKDISARLNVKAPSTTKMLDKLSKTGYIEWTPRKGIRLSDIGREYAKNLVVNHIILELFLRRILRIKNKDQINKIACDLEHHIDANLRELFKDLLGISDILKNVDNFILEDKFPDHIITRPIYSESRLMKLLDGIEIKIVDLTQDDNLKNQIKAVFNETKKNL